MGDNYQAVYDAVRSKFSGIDVDGSIQSAINNMGISHHISMMADRIAQTFVEYERPCVVFKPKLSKDGNMWCVLLGDNLREGVSGFGETVNKAMHNFDINFLNDKA